MSGQRATTTVSRRAVVDEIKEKGTRPRSMPPEVIASLEKESQKPNMILTSRGGSFVRSRQNRLLRASTSEYPANSGQQDHPKVKKARPASMIEKGTRQEVSKSTKENSTSAFSKSSAKATKTATGTEINRRSSQGNISSEKRSKSSGSLSLSRSNSKGSLKSYEMPTAASSARQNNVEITSRSRSGSAVELHSSTLSSNEATAALSSGGLSRSSSRSSIKSNNSQSTSSYTTKPRRSSTSSKGKTPTPAKSTIPNDSSSNLKSQSKASATPAKSKEASNSQRNLENKPASGKPPQPPPQKTVEISANDETDSEEEYQEITETILVNLPQSPQHDTYNNFHQKSPSLASKGSINEPNQIFHPSDHFQPSIVEPRSEDTQSSKPALIQEDTAMTSTLSAPMTSLQLPVQEDRGRATPTSHEVLDYFNTTLAGYRTPRSRASASETDRQSVDSHQDDSKQDITFNSSSENVFSSSHRSSIASSLTLTGHSGSESESELFGRDDRPQDFSDGRGRNSVKETKAKGLTYNSAPSSTPKELKIKNKHRTPKVMKYEGNVKTIRQQIKPGTVGDLTHLFDESEMTEMDQLQNLTYEHPVQNAPHTMYRRASTIESDIEHFDSLASGKLFATRPMASQENDNLHSNWQRERREKQTNEKTPNTEDATSNHSSPYYHPYLSDNGIESTTNTGMLSSRSSNADETQTGANREEDKVVQNLYLNSQSSINDDKWPRNSFLDKTSASSGPYFNTNDTWGDFTIHDSVIFTNEAGKNDATKDTHTNNIDTRKEHVTDIEVDNPRLDTVKKELGPNLWAGAKRDPLHKSSFYQVSSVSDSIGDTTYPRYAAQSEEGGVGVGSLLSGLGSRPEKSGTDTDEVLSSSRRDSLQEIVLSDVYEVREGGSMRRKRSLKLSHHEDDNSRDSVSKHSTGSAGGESRTNLASWTTLDDIAINDAMIDDLKDPLHEKSSPKTNSAITSARNIGETAFLVNGGDGNNNLKEIKTDHNFTSDRNFSYLNGHTSHPVVTNGYEVREVQVNSRMDGEAERADNVIAQLPTDLSSQTADVNLFAQKASREMERGGGGKGRRDDTSDNENGEEGRQKQIQGAVTVDRKAHLGQFSTSFPAAQVENNESHLNDETHPSQVGVRQLDDFNAILNGLDLNAVSDSQLSSHENTFNEQVISQKEYNSLEHSAQKNDSMKRGTNVKKSSSTGSDRKKVVTSKVSLIKDTYVSGQQLDQLEKTISDDETDVGATKESHGSIDDEIRELHVQLSPGISNNLVEETTFNLVQSTSSNQGSLSSRSSTLRDKTPQRETVFNKDFFTSDENIREERNESDVQFARNDSDQKNQGRELTLSNRRDAEEISYLPGGGVPVSSKTNGEVTSSDITRQSSWLTQRNLPVNKDETNVFLQPGASHTVVVGDKSEKGKESEKSDSDSSLSSKSESVNDLPLKSNGRPLADGHGDSQLRVTSARSQVYEISGGNDSLSADHFIQKNLSFKSDDHSEDEQSHKSRSSSSSSVTSSSDSDEGLSDSGSNKSGQRKRKRKTSDIFEISKSKDDDLTTGNGKLTRDAFFGQNLVRSIPNDSDETYEKFLLEKNTETEGEANMAAIVGEVSSFNIHRKVTSVEESSTVPSDRSTVSQVQTMPVEGGAQPDIFLIQDNSGDVYALQEVGTTSQSNSTQQSATTIRTVNRDDYSTQATPVQPALHSGGNYLTDYSKAETDIYVDSASVNDDKAREVIAAFLNSGSNTAVNQSFDSSVNRGISSHSHRQSGSVVDLYSRQLDDARINASDSVYVSNTVPSNGPISPHSIVVHQGMRGDDLLKNSTVTVNQEVSTKTDNSQTWDIHGYEPYTTGSGGEGGYKSSMVVTNFNTPQQQAHVTYTSQPRADTSFDSQRSNSFMNTSQTASAFQPLNINVSPDQGVAPFATKPVTIQTTTNALVGEKVDMTIDFPPGKQKYPPHKITATAELASSSSDEEKKGRYVIRSPVPKSSLKRGSAYNSSNTSFDSNPDIFYTRKETVTGDIVIGGKKRGSTIIDNRKDKKLTSVRSGSLSPSSANGSSYVIRQDSNRNRESNRREQRQEAHKIRKANKSSYKHHSPERIFTNPKLSLRKPEYGERSASSEEESHSQRYKTVTRVFVDGDKSGSSSSSPTTQYRVLSPKSFNRSRDDDGHSLEGKSYQIVNKSRGRKDSGSGSLSENESEMEQRHLYKVVSKSDSIMDKRDFRAHSSPKPENTSSHSIEEAVIHRTERVQPSRYQKRPTSIGSHKTVIQLEIGDQNAIKEKSRSESQTSGSTKSGMARAKSLDVLNSRENFILNKSQDNSRMWRTARAKSVDSSSDGSSSDYDGSGPLNLSASGLVKTSKQKKGSKTYVVNSTMDDQYQHPSGYYKSTIDINEDMPDGARRSYNVSLNRPRSLIDEQNYKQSDRTTERVRNNMFKTEEKSVYYVRQESQQPNPHHVTKFRIHPSPDSGQGTEVASSDGENEHHKQKFERVERIYEVKSEPMLPEQFQSETEVSTDLRVLRGKILIKNRLDSDHDHDDTDFDQNVNVFDNSFHMDKDNPLYSSDTDLQASLQKEEEEELYRQINQDITFEHVDKILRKNKSRSSKLEVSQKPRRKQNLSTLLLSKLANVDSQDIRQTIDVQHHNEEIFGNIDFIHADGQHTGSQNTSNFDSVSEKVELTLQQGKAFVIIKVIAERIVPTDYEFNVWRKSQAIVTRQIEVDLLANDQRRRFYNHVMDTQGLPASVEYHSTMDGRHQERLTSQEKQLSSLETLKLFSQILDVADGQGEQDHTSMSTKQEMGQLPASGADLLY